MDNIRAEHNQHLDTLETIFARDVQQEIGWQEQLLFIKGARGIGKTTIILQHIKDVFGYDTKALYVTMDSINLINTTLVELAKQHYTAGGTHLFIDEIHKYDNWSKELKHIYDLYKKMKIVVSGSSILDMYKGNADLSRRAVTHTIQGLSLREFINIEAKIALPVVTLSSICSNHITIAQNIIKQVNPIQYLPAYLQYGYYPFYLQGNKYFHQKLNNALNQIIEIDIPRLFKLEVGNINKVKKLLYHIATSVPFQPNSSKLASSLELNRQTLNTYLQYMQEAQILQLLWDDSKAYSLISKPEKIYLQNTNICHLVPSENNNIGSLRETFFMNQVSALHKVTAAAKGDFLINNKYTFEVGGNTKTYKQIATIKNSFLAIDNELVGVGNKIPLWLFGFLY